VLLLTSAASTASRSTRAPTQGPSDREATLHPPGIAMPATRSEAPTDHRPRVRTARSLAQNGFEAPLERPGDRFAHEARLEALNGRLEEPLDDQALGVLEIQPA
jgi:hypothetical protein